MHIPQTVFSYWRSNADGELLTGDLAVSSIASRHGTPLFVYDRSIVERKYSALRNTLPDHFAIYYSVKANPNPAFLNFFLERGCGLEVASAGELYQALAAGCPPEKIFFAGPGKTEKELKFAIEKEIGEIHAESRLELERISALSRTRGVRARVGVRVNPSEDAQGGAMQMGGKPAPFGIDEENLPSVLQAIGHDPSLEFCGIHLFVGTQILDHKLLLAQYRKGLEIAGKAAKATGVALRTVDFGGGLGIPYFDGETELDLAGLKEALLKIVEEIESDDCFAGTQFVIEPGRFLVGEAGVYVTRINDIKESRGKRYLILDGGMHHHLAASGNLGQVIKRNFPVAILNKVGSPATDTYDVVGPLCTPLDTLGRSVHLPSAEVGDLVGIFQSGAYARAASPLQFLSHPSPPEVWANGREEHLVRRRGRYEDCLRDVEWHEYEISRAASLSE